MPHAGPDLACPPPPPPPSTFQSGVDRQHAPQQQDPGQRPRHLADQPDPGHADPGATRSRRTATTASGRAVERQPGRGQRRSRARAARRSRSRARATTPSSTTASTDNGGGGVLVGLTDSAPVVDLPSNDNRDREATRSPRAAATAIEVEGNSKAYVTGNQLLYNVAPALERRRHLAVSTRATRVVHGNDVRTNKGGISLENSSDNRLEANDASESEGTGISLEALSVSNVLLNNISSNNDGDGIYVGDETSGGSGMWIEGNSDQQQQGLRHLRAQGQPHGQGQHRQRQRRLGHLGQRGLERPRQHRRRRQQGAGQRRRRSTRSR